jgi:hypothetical protein
VSDDWDRLRREQEARTGWSSGGGWDLSADEREEVLRVSGIGKDVWPPSEPGYQDLVQRERARQPVIVGAGMKSIIEKVNDWLDGRVAEPYKDQPLAQDWARVAKLAEELGEMREASHGRDLSADDHIRMGAVEAVIGRSVSALIACTGQNPRKGISGTQDEMLKELGDVVCCGLFAIQHFTGDAELTAAIVEAGMLKALNRATGATRP